MTDNKTNNPPDDAILVLETSAIVGRRTPGPIRYLLDIGKITGVEIADVVVSEFSCLLPSYIDIVLDEINSASGEEERQAVAEKHARQSPNSGVRGRRNVPAERDMAGWLRLLADNAFEENALGQKEFTGKTSFGDMYDDRCRAELEMAAGRKSDFTQHYTLSLEDVLTLLDGDDEVEWGIDSLRVPTRVVKDMGWIDRDDLKGRIHDGDFWMTLDQFRSDAEIGGEPLDQSHPFSKFVEQEIQKGVLGEEYATVKHLTKYGFLDEIGKENDEESDKPTIGDLGRTWKFTLGDAFASGLLPKKELVHVANILGFPLEETGERLTLEQMKEQNMLIEGYEEIINSFTTDKGRVSSLPNTSLDLHGQSKERGKNIQRILSSNAPLEVLEAAGIGILKPECVYGDRERIKDPLYEQGFFETALTVRAVKKLASSDPEGKIFSAMHKIADDSKLVALHKKAFNKMAKDKNNLHYEKVFSEAFINNIISIDEFIELAEKSGGITRTSKTGNTYESKDGAITITINQDNPEKSKVRINTDGFETRKGNQTLKTHSQTVTRSGNKVDKFEEPTGKEIVFPLEELRELAGRGFKSKGEGTEYYRVFDAMLTPAVRENAFNVRENAIEILGGENEEKGMVRLHQLEQDYAEKYNRKYSKEGIPIGLNHFSAQHEFVRRLRWDLGEAATLRTGLNNDVKTFIVNTDEDLASSVKQTKINPLFARKLVNFRSPIARVNIDIKYKKGHAKKGSERSCDIFNIHPDTLRLGVAISILQDPRMADEEERKKLMDRFKFIRYMLKDKRNFMGRPITIMETAQRAIDNIEQLGLDEEQDKRWVQRIEESGSKQSAKSAG